MVGVAGSIVSYHVRLAVAIAALAPKLRLASVLALTWSENIDADFRFITVRRHKTVTRVRRPQVVPISEQLRSILHDARRRTHTHVVEYRGRRSNRSGAVFKRRPNVPGCHTAVTSVA